MDILSTGYFLVAREAFRLFKRAEDRRQRRLRRLQERPRRLAQCRGLLHRQGRGDPPGALPGAGGRGVGIRVNTVNPDAVLRGSKIWTGEWREQRAAAYKMSPDELEEHYRQRSMLKRQRLPRGHRRGDLFLRLGLSAKSTGNIINVDAGNAQSFAR